jgi:hypothetical protein
MITRGLILGTLFSFVSAFLFAYVGCVVGARRTTPHARLAIAAFATWWYGLAAVTMVGTLVGLLAADGRMSLPLFIAFTHLILLGLVVALWGLVYYLLYLFTGRRGLWVPLTVFYAVYWAALLYFIQRSEPIGIIVKGWSAQLAYAKDTTGPLGTVLLLLLVLPQIVGAFAKFTLFFRTRERTQRFRIALVSWSIIVWFSTGLLTSSPSMAASDAWQLASRLVGLGAALAILVAYQPPGWLRRRLAVQGIDDQPDLPPMSNSSSGPRLNPVALA